VGPRAMLVQQRKFVSPNYPIATRRRQHKYYPGENVRAARFTSLLSTCWGRVKITHDITRDVMVMNVLPEPREELLVEDLWRYRMEHVRSMEENHHICQLRMKAAVAFPKSLVNAPKKPPPRRVFFSNKYDEWENPGLPDREFPSYDLPETPDNFLRKPKIMTRRKTGPKRLPTKPFADDEGPQSM